ncbi:MAG: hypothetical protein J2P19_18625 [Pseudonocardia sp.]|nr:hypothetical protein [Pseudonocardia sp.]
MKQGAFSGFAAAAALLAVVGASACGGSAAPSQPPPAAPPPTTANASPGAGASGSIKGIPFYQPSTVRSQTEATVVLSSPDPVTKVSDYYVNMVNSGGWTTVAKSITLYSGNLTIKKSGQGATISVAPSGSGSVITISTYPAA